MSHGESQYPQLIFRKTPCFKMYRATRSVASTRCQSYVRQYHASGLLWSSSSFLANLLAEIVQAIYAVNPPPPGAPNKRLSYFLLEERLDKFYLEIPEHLQIRVVGDGMIPDPTSSPPPHFFALHLMYWCSAILLHRPLYVSCPLVEFVCRCLLGSTVYEENDTEQLFLNSPRRSKR
jgi:hypothetical protein